MSRISILPRVSFRSRRLRPSRFGNAGLTNSVPASSVTKTYASFAMNGPVGGWPVFAGYSRGFWRLRGSTTLVVQGFCQTGSDRLDACDTSRWTNGLSTNRSEPCGRCGRPLWTIVTLTLLAAGTGLAATSVVLAWQTVYRRTRVPEGAHVGPSDGSPLKHGGVAREYAVLKRRLAARTDATDALSREAYALAKGEVVEPVVELASSAGHPRGF